MASRSSPPPPTIGHRSPSAWLTALLMAAFLSLVLLLVGSPAAPAYAADPLRWTLSDPSGGRWGLTLFEQPDPAWPSGWRLRLSARSPGVALDHARPLELNDGVGGHWELPNRSEELVEPGSGSLPPTAAQFDADALRPRPQQVLPLQLRIPLEGRNGSDSEVILLMLRPEVVAALHNLPSTPKGAT